MKRKGHNSDYIAERNMELNRLFNEHCLNVPLPYQRLVNLPCSRFWIGEDRAYRIVMDMISGKKKQSVYDERGQMHQEIFARVMEIRKHKPDRSLMDIVCDVVNAPAPKFYLTPKNARLIVFRYKQRQRQRLLRNDKR